MSGGVHGSAAQGYTRGADAYVAGRPEYHPSVLDAVTAAPPAGVVIDLGAGTGIASAALVDRGVEVVAVEPVPSMRAAFTSRLPDVPILDGGAESIPVDAGSAAAVLAAQAFHWFDHARALDEICRVLGSDGHLITLWNVRDESVAWMREWTAIVDHHAGETPRYRSMRWRRAIEGDRRFRLEREVSALNPQASSPEHAVQRALSTSFIAALDTARREDVASRVRQLVGPLGDAFDFPYRSEAQIWRCRR